MAFQKKGSLWENTGPNGKYLSGLANEDIKKGDRIFVFKVKDKSNDKAPDFNLAVGDKERE